MDTRSYEQSRWQADELGNNIEQMCYVVADRGFGSLAHDLKELSRSPGPLNACLARSSCHTTPIGAARAVFLGKALCTLSSCLGCTAETAIEHLLPLLRWDSGLAPLDLGFEFVGDETTASLLCGQSSVPVAALHAVWLVGLLGLAGLLSDQNTAAEMLRLSAVRPTALSGLVQEATAAADGALSGLETELVGPTLSETPMSAERRVLWNNALVMARRAVDVNPDGADVFLSLLGHVRAGGMWPLPHSANELFREAATAKDPDAANFWSAEFVLNIPGGVLGDVSLMFLNDPLQVLNIGNAFDTCLRLGGLSQSALLGWAVNTNVRVVAVIADDGRMIGRRTVGLSVQDAVGLSPYKAYPLGCRVIEDATDLFLDQLSQHTRLDRYDGSAVDDTCALGYQDLPQLQN